MRNINQHQKDFKEKVESTRGDLGKRPEWLKIRLKATENYTEVKQLVKEKRLNTVCEEARCPNLSECWNHKTATFMILGDTCTRSCGFCNVKVGLPTELDLDEPIRVAESVKVLGLRHAVITSVNRDELLDGGAGIFSETVRLINQEAPSCTVEILIPDFKGSEESFQIIMKHPPHILNHNIETVKRLYHAVRPQAKYERSLELLRWFKEHKLRTKSGLMVGIGEEPDEVIDLLRDLKEYGCEIITIGQYLQPSPNHLPIHRYVTPEEFAWYHEEGMKMGFLAVESAPLVRSSYHADKQARLITVE